MKKARANTQAFFTMEVAKKGEREDTVLLPNRMISLWPYTKLNDHRVHWGEKYIMLDQDRNANQAFKIGLPNKDGWAAYANNGHLFVKRFQHVDGVEYPDFGYSSFETYTCDYMTEIESLSPLFELEPDCSIEHKEIWNLYDNVKTPENETDIDDIILTLSMRSPYFCLSLSHIAQICIS